MNENKPGFNARMARGHRNQRGVSVIELMVALVISLLVALAAANSAQFFTASQRQGIGTGNAGTGATNALGAIEEDLGLAGLGFFGDSRFLCNGLRISLAAVDHSQASFAPLQVTRTGERDQIDLFFAAQVAGGANVQTDTNTTGEASVDLETFLPVAVGQAVLLAPATAGVDCVVRSVTAIDSYTPTFSTTPRQRLMFANTGDHNQVAHAPAITYPPKSAVALLGELSWHRYRLDGNDLVFEEPFNGNSVVLASNVVGLRVQYGVANVGAMAVTQWVEPDAFGAITAANVARVRVIRVGIMVRSAQPEKPDAAGNCSASDAQPVLLGETLDVPDVGTFAWNCYRYRSAVTVVPLRNVIMGLR
jgi:type IV pilus assembly protein PilW